MTLSHSSCLAREPARFPTAMSMIVFARMMSAQEMAVVPTLKRQQPHHRHEYASFGEGLRNKSRGPLMLACDSHAIYIYIYICIAPRAHTWIWTCKVVFCGKPKGEKVGFGHVRKHWPCLKDRTEPRNKLAIGKFASKPCKGETGNSIMQKCQRLAERQMDARMFLKIQDPQVGVLSNIRRSN